MTNFLKAAASTGLVIMLGLTASAQSGTQAEKSSSQIDEKSNLQQGEKSDNQKKDAQHQRGSGQVESIRGELAAVSVVGETMINYDTGRGVVAEFSYLTILGSPSDSRGRQAGSDRDESKKAAQGNASGSEKRDRDSTRDQAKKGQGRSGGASAGRRNVYEIAIGPDTQVRDRGSQDGQGAASKQEGSARERSQSALGQLELGDRVLVGFERLSDQGKSGAVGEAKEGSANQARHGRHRIVRGVARTLTILSSPDDGDDQKGAQDRKGDDSSEKGQSGADAKQKSSDQGK